MSNESFIPGVIEDPRSHEEKLRDYQDDEIATAGVPLKWEEKKAKRMEKILHS